MKKMFWLRFGALLIVLSLALAVAGCAKPAETPAPAPAPAAAPAAEPVDEIAIIQAHAAEYFATLPPTNHVIDAAEVKGWLDGNRDAYYVVDIRKAEDYAKGHIDGAVNIPFGKVGENLDKLPTDKQIVVTCYTGQTAGQTISLLRLSGFNVVSLKGGMTNGWLKAELPVVQ